MTDYNFHTLNSQDLELLARDLLNAELKTIGSVSAFKSFPTGRDQGIDLLDFASSDGRYNTIVQVKHYQNIPYNVLLRDLTQTRKDRVCEKDKILRLNPLHFKLVTSQKLTRKNKEDIVAEFIPYANSIDDIIDNIELNRLLTKHTSIEKAHYKLWFSNTAVFEKILHNDIHGRSEQLEEDIQNKFKLYVVTSTLVEAEKILFKQQFVVITGEPGTGKTSLAEMLLYRLAGQDYEMYWIDKSVSEVDMLLKKDDSKQVFYFDDFLGHTRFEIENSKGQEKGLLHFLRRIRKHSNKYFILTTRTSIINQASIESERFKNSDIFIGNFQIYIKGLSLDEKIQIVQNHLAVNNIPIEYTNGLSASKIENISYNPNFSPRLIEFVTKKTNYTTVEPSKYYSYIIEQLKNPEEVWRHAYEQQINDCDRFLLTTLFSFGRSIKQEFLEEAFEHRMQYEIKENNAQRGDFFQSFKVLLGSFITLKNFHNVEKVDFINPSLEDFLRGYLINNEREKIRVAYSFRFIEQITQRFRSSGNILLILRPEAFFYDKLKTERFRTVKVMQYMSKENYVNIYLGLIAWMFFKIKAGIELSLFHFKKVDWSVTLDDVNFYHLFGFMQIAHMEIDFKKFFIPHFNGIALFLFENNPDMAYLEKIKGLFHSFDLSFVEFIKADKHFSIVKESIDNYFSDEISMEVDHLKNHATSVDQVDSTKDDLINKITSCYEMMHIYESPVLDEFEDEKWDAICHNNFFEELMKKED